MDTITAAISAAATEIESMVADPQHPAHERECLRDTQDALTSRLARRAPAVGERFIRAVRLAARGHGSQRDKAGSPYLLHPLTLAERVAHLGESHMIVAVLHDYFEDCAEHAADNDLSLLTEAERDALDRLTHADEDDYLTTYLDAILESDLAAAVKLADLSHNLDLSRRTTAPFTQQDLDRCNKYRMALNRLATNTE